MIITFGTQKGGVGKTTIAIAMANYLVLDKKKKVFVYDFDFQKSFYKRWEYDNEFRSDVPQIYDVKIIEKIEDLPFKNEDQMMELKNSDDIHIFDLGGMLNSDYSSLLVYSDFIVVPFEYSNVSIESTMVFIKVITEKLGSESSLIFIRNRYDAGYNYPNQEYMDKVLQEYGTLLPTPIFKRNNLQKINTREFKRDMRKDIKKNLDELIESINELSEVKI